MALIIYWLEGADGKFGTIALSICSWALISVASSEFCLGIAKFDANDKTIKIIANVQVVFF